MLVLALINRQSIKEYFRLVTPKPEPHPNPQINPVFVEITEGLHYLERLNNNQSCDDIPMDENEYVLDESERGTNPKQTRNNINFLDENAYVLDNSET